MNQRWLPVLLIGLLAGPAKSQTGRRDIEFNGPALSGTDLGHPRALSVARLREGVQLKGGPLHKGVVVAAGALLVPGGADLLGAEFLGVATDGKPVRLRIEELAVAPDPRPETATNENQDIALYQLSYQDGAFTGTGSSRAFQPAGDRRPVCPTGEQALVIAGRWDYHLGLRGDSGRRSKDPAEATFACQGGAIAKCIERMGYKPWLGPNFFALHEACVRAIRADYCGDGQSLTRAGLQVNFFDVAGIQRDTEAWTAEASWTPAGAHCISSTRLLDHPIEKGISVRATVARGCGARFSLKPCVPLRRGAAGPPILWTEHPPR